jgi:antitoxin HicB
MKTLEEYLTLTYPIELVADTEQGGYFAQHPTLPGCMAQGETADEAVASLNEARKEWMAARLAARLPIPEPASTQPSGKVLLRMPSWMHAELTALAEREGTSLNQLLVSALASHLGTRSQSTQMDELLAEVRSLKDALQTKSARTFLSYTPKAAQRFTKAIFYTGCANARYEKGPKEDVLWAQSLNDLPREAEPDTTIDMTDLVIAGQQSRR